MTNHTPREQLLEMSKKGKVVIAQQKAERISEYEKEPARCAFCNAPLPYNKRHNKFCNQSCSASFNNGIRDRVPHKKKLLTEKTCKYCGKPIVKSPDETYSRALNKTFCSTECYLNFHKTDYINKWKVGEVSGTTKSNEVHEKVRAYMLEKANYKCTRCGWGEVNPATGKVPVQIHHKDGDCTNNKEDNLEVLCPNCHSLTSTYGAINKGSGRFNRLKYKTKDYLLQKVNEEFTGDMPK